ncbi:MAG TPA: 50S ribosomal protein L6 [Candidatus Babeliales bacterium]|jgi:large subunit ribosomal protein L6|nr:50S ribosomal protein L6 [Candidatus Babeliales bacterium]
MSKIGRKPIDISGLQINVEGQDIRYKGPKGSGIYILPEELKAEIENSILLLRPSNINKKDDREVKALWGLHRALLANKISGIRQPFSSEVQINGLGFKAVPAGKNLVMSLGYSHKINFPVPDNVMVSIDKSGQKLVFESSDKTVLGATISSFRALRPPEVYKGTGIKRANEIIRRKAGKKKA